MCVLENGWRITRRQTHKAVIAAILEHLAGILPRHVSYSLAHEKLVSHLMSAETGRNVNPLQAMVFILLG